MFDSIIDSQLFSSIALTLIHFLWQGIAVAVILKSALMITANQHSRLRYFFSSLAMTANFLLPFITFAVIYQPEYLIEQHSSAINDQNILGLPLLVNESSFNADILAMLPYLTVAWLSTVLCLCGKLIFQMFSVNQLPKHRSPLPYVELHARFNELVNKLNIKKTPKLIVSLTVDVPMAIGWIKPVVLLPASMITGLTPAQLDMLLLHELAHIRRHDYLVNLIQSFVEIVLFFHPAVFWVSKQMRIEREYCSDDIAVQHCGDALAYAHTLTDTASLCNKHRHAIPTMAMAASGGDLKQRVLRLVNHHSCTTAYDKSKWLVSVVIVCSFLLLTSRELAQLTYLDMSSNSTPTGNLIEMGQMNTQGLTPINSSNRQLTSPVIAEPVSEEKPAAELITTNPINTPVTNTTKQPQGLLGNSVKATAVSKTSSAKTTIEQSSLPENTVNKTPKVVSQIANKAEVTAAPELTNPSALKPATNTVIPTQNNNTVLTNKTQVAKLTPQQKVKNNTPVKKTSIEQITNIPLTEQANIATIATKNKAVNKYAQELQALSQPLTYQDPITQFEQRNKQPNKNNFTGKSSNVAQLSSYKSAKLVNIVDPKYPIWAQRKKLELDLLVNFSINKDGKVKNIQIEEKTKASYFKNSIIKAMEQWQFLPAEQDGQPVESTMSKIFSFNLNERY
jgi:TonB family protein